LSSDDWDSLARIRRGTKIKIELQDPDRTTINGKLIAVDNGGIRIDTGKKERQISRARVGKVSQGGHLGLFTGMALGAPAGSVTALVMTIRDAKETQTIDNYFEHASFKHAYSILIPITAGTVVGGPADLGKKPVYEAPRK